MLQTSSASEPKPFIYSRRAANFDRLNSVLAAHRLRVTGLFRSKFGRFGPKTKLFSQNLQLGGAAVLRRGASFCCSWRDRATI